MAALNFPTSPTIGDTHTENSKSWRWDGTTWLSITTSAVGYTGSSGTGGSTGYTGSIGDGSNTSYTITHGLDSNNIMTAVKEQSSGYFVYPDVKYVASNQVVVEFETAPTTNQYQIYVIGFDV
jgi:hypothetical protein